MVKLGVVAGVFVLFVSMAVPAAAVDLHYDTGKTYGVTRQSTIIEVPADNASIAQAVYSQFAAARPFVKVTRPGASFPGSAAFQTYEAMAGGWYLTLPPDSSTVDILSAFTARTTKPVVAEITPYDAAFIKSLHTRFPQVRIHTAQYLFWPRSDVKSLLGQTPPPVIEAVSIRLKENSQSDLFVTFKAIFDTIFDASNDVEAGSGVNINYPANTLLAISDITPEWSDDVKNVAFRIGVAGGAVVTYLEDQGKTGVAPAQYIGLGKYAGMSANGSAVAARFAKFISLNPNIIWPMAMAGNGDPYDNTYFQESNSKPIVGVIGLVQGAPEGVIVNTSGQTVPVNLPGNPGSSAYSSVTGAYRFGAQITMAPWEAIVFGANSTNISASPPPPVQPTAPPVPTAVPTDAEPTPPTVPTSALSASLFPTSPPAAPSPTAAYFPIGYQSTPVPQNSSPATASGGYAIGIKTGLRLLVIKTNPLFQAAGNSIVAIVRYDSLLEKYINSILAQIAAPFIRQ